MIEEFFVENLKNSVIDNNISRLDLSDDNYKYGSSIKSIKLKNLIESINIKEGEETPEVLDIPLVEEKSLIDDSDSIFFKQLRSNVIKPE